MFFELNLLITQVWTFLLTAVKCRYVERSEKAAGTAQLVTRPQAARNGSHDSISFKREDIFLPSKSSDRLWRHPSFIRNR